MEWVIGLVVVLVAVGLLSASGGGGGFGGRSAHITYIDADGSWTQRYISSASLEVSPNGYPALRAYCKLRHDVRTFRIDRIHTLIDTSTGEVLNDPQDILAWARRG